jgi:hypothetical protein
VPTTGAVVGTAERHREDKARLGRLCPAFAHPNYDAAVPPKPSTTHSIA